MNSLRPVSVSLSRSRRPLAATALPATRRGAVLEEAETSGETLGQLFRPLLTPRAAAWLLGTSVDHLVRQAEAREVRAYNLAIATETGCEEVAERSPDRMLRFLRPSIERLLIPALAPTPLGAMRLEDALPHSRETLLRREVQQFLDCSADHVRRLQLAGLLTGPTLTNTGSGRLQHIARESLLGFLAAREL